MTQTVFDKIILDVIDGLAAEARANCAAAVAQSLPSDDQIIIGHVKTSVAVLDRLIHTIARIKEVVRDDHR